MQHLDYVQTQMKIAHRKKKRELEELFQRKRDWHRIEDDGEDWFLQINPMGQKWQESTNQKD